MKEIKNKLLKLRVKFNNEGSAFVDVAVKIAIGVVVGSLVITYFQNNIDGVLTALFDKIKQVLEITAT